MIVSFIVGAFTTAGLFILCLIIVVGIKSVYYTLTKRFSKKTPVPAPEKPKSVTPKKRKSVRTIEIDPDLADRIYFRKSG